MVTTICVFHRNIASSAGATETNWVTAVVGKVRIMIGKYGAQRLWLFMNVIDIYRAGALYINMD